MERELEMWLAIELSFCWRRQSVAGGGLGELIGDGVGFAAAVQSVL